LRRAVTVGEVTAALLVEGPDAAVVEILGAGHRAERRADGWWIDGAPAPRVVIGSGAVHVFDGGCVSFAIPIRWTGSARRARGRM
jgi:3-methylcrotonyl-CoA carboxylase alpha subunit